MDSPLVIVLSTIWSLFTMYVIVWRMKMYKFEEQMEAAMERIVKEYKGHMMHVADEHLTKRIKTVLVEARVIDNRVEVKFVKNTEQEIV